MKKSNSFAGRLFLMLFALPFASVGVFATVMIVWSCADWMRMQRWVEVPCQILQANLEVHDGDDSDTYRVTARYQYTFAGNEFVGERVGIHTMSDNIGSYHEKAADELKQYKTSEEPFRCFVNPQRPDEAVVYRKLRIELLGFMLIFALAFGGVGFGLLFWSVYSVKHERREDQLRTDHPGQPWMWQEDWAEGKIKSSNKAAMIGSFVFAAIWNLISSPVLFILPGELRDGNHLALLALLFPAVGLGLLIWALRNFFRWRKYGESIFQMASVPGVLGGPLAGVVNTSVNLRPQNGYQVELSCVEQVTSGSGKNRSTSEHIVWQDARRLARDLAEDDMTRSAIPVQFALPYNGKQSTVSGRRDVFWRLTVQAEEPGIDYSAQFRVPVFKTPDSSPDFQLDSDVLADYEVQREPLDVVREAGIRVEPTASGQRFVFPIAHRPGVALGLTSFLMIWLGFIVGMIYLGAPILFPIVFGLFALLLVWGVLDLWLWTSNIETRRGAISLSSGMAGLTRTKTKTYQAEDIEDFQTSRGMQAGNRLYYSLQLKTNDGKTHTIGKRLTSKTEAERIAEIIMAEVTA